MNQILDYFKFEPDDGARRKVRASPKSVVLSFGKKECLHKNSMAMHPIGFEIFFKCAKA